MKHGSLLSSAIKILGGSLFLLFCFVILLLSVRGHLGNPTPEELNTDYWKDEGPLELSPERGRFALVYSLAENNSFSFSVPIARFVTPDLAYANGKYVSLFAPGVSFLAMPGFFIGKMFGASQVGTFMMVGIFAILNALLIKLIAVRLGARQLAGWIAAFVFLFATPAYAYAVTLYQHHISTFLILLSIYVLVRFRSLVSLAVVWFLCALSIPIDYPNLILMAPIGVYALLRVIVPEETKEALKVTIKFGGLLTILTALLPLGFFLWFNVMSYNNPLQLSGTLPSVKAIDEAGNPAKPEDAGTDADQSFFEDPTQQQKSAVGFFKTRNMIRGFYIHLFSPDRGIVYYTPVILFGLFGFVLLYKSHPGVFQMMVGVIGMTLLLYSMWGDPWGGWAFASRYLIPVYGVMAVMIALFLTRWQRNSLVLLIFFLIFAYSTGVNTLGALTSNRNPPKVEILGLEAVTHRQERYTFMRNWEFLQANRSKSFMYQTYFADKYEAVMYYWAMTSGLVLVGYFLTMGLRITASKQK